MPNARALLCVCGWGGCLVLYLQKHLRALEMHFDNGTWAAEESPSFAKLWSLHSPPLPAGATRLQVLQAQLSQVCAQQEQLMQQVDNFTRSPGLAPPLRIWTPHRRSC